MSRRHKNQQVGKKYLRLLNSTGIRVLQGVDRGTPGGARKTRAALLASRRLLETAPEACAAVSDNKPLSQLHTYTHCLQFSEETRSYPVGFQKDP